MYDGIDVADLPEGASAYAGYVDGYDTIDAVKSRFPDAHILSIAVHYPDAADCLDIETGAATIGDAPTWYNLMKRDGYAKPCFYIEGSQINSLVQTLADSGINRGSYRLFSAHWIGMHTCGPHSCGICSTDCDGTQYASNNSYDTSYLNNDFFEVNVSEYTWQYWNTAGELSFAEFAEAAGFRPAFFLGIQFGKFGDGLNGTAGLFDYINTGDLNAKMPKNLRLWTRVSN